MSLSLVSEVVGIRFHRLVQSDLNKVLSLYGQVSEKLADDCYNEFLKGVNQAIENPKFLHFDACGLRRCNLKRFPYHFLYSIGKKELKVWVFRHNHQRPSFGVRRF